VALEVTALPALQALQAITAGKSEDVQCGNAEGRTDVYCIPEGDHPGANGPKGANHVIGKLDHYLSQEWMECIRKL
jgi:hypothetical protein